jgi:hypothetical protein
MKTSLQVRLLGCVLLGWLLTGACGGRTSNFGEIPQSGETQTLGGNSLFFEGELLSWQLSWKGVVAATSNLAVGEAGQMDGVPALVVKAQSSASEVTAVFNDFSEEVTSVINVDSGAPISTTTLDNDDGDLGKVVTTYAETRLETVYQPSKGEAQRWTTQHPEGAARVYDRFAVLAILRAWKPTQGSVGTFHMQDGRSFYAVRVVAAAEEPVRLDALGGFDCYRLDGEATRMTQDGKSKGKEVKRRFSIWISADDRRLPVQFRAETRYGDVFAKMVNFQHDTGRAVVVD